MKLWCSRLNTPTWIYQSTTLLLRSSPLSAPPSLLAVLFLLPAAGEVEPFLLEWNVVRFGDLEDLHFLRRMGSHIWIVMGITELSTTPLPSVSQQGTLTVLALEAISCSLLVPPHPARCQQ